MIAHHRSTFYTHGFCLITLCAFNLLLNGHSALCMYEAVKICKYLSNEWNHEFVVRWSVNIFYLHFIYLVFKCTRLKQRFFLFIYSTHHLHETLRRECTIRLGSILAHTQVRRYGIKKTSFFFSKCDGGSSKLDN